MKAYLDCYPCFFIQALKTARLVTSEEKAILQILKEVSLYLSQVSFNVTPSEIGLGVYRIISRITGVKDPYKEVKERCIRQALALYPGLKQLIDASEDRLMTAVRLAIAGNLYIADNAGETVFDRLLIEEIGQPVVYAVREKPIINDATREDAVLSGLDKVSKVMSSGCDSPGNILKFCSAEFLRVYRSADLIISKGQGNYEALSDEKRPVFFLLKAKCPVVARDLGLEEGSIVLLKRGEKKKVLS